MILGDTCDNTDITPLCTDADVVVHEATNENAHEQQCRDNGHSTPGLNIYLLTILAMTVQVYTPF